MVLKNPYETLLTIGQQINTTHDISVLLDKIMDSAMRVLEAERGFILLKKNDRDSHYETVTARNLSRDKIESMKAHSSSVVRRVLESHEALISVDAQEDDRFSGAESIILQKIHSVICTPLMIEERIIGAIYMDRQMSSDQFDQDNLDFLNAFAKQAAIAIVNTRLLSSLQNENKKLKERISISDRFPDIIGKSKPMQKIFEMVHSVAPSTATVLIEGESGTGKELVARAIHDNSNQKDKPFIPIFCGSLSENLMESELFGHKRGAFTGAHQDKAGLFEEADGGTLFLDEVGEISLPIQTKLLRVLQEGEIKRVGDNTIRKVNVRVLCATNRNLQKEVEEGNFREDLYYRLNVIYIKMPPLRERPDDILLLAEHFLQHYALKNKKNFKGFSKEALRYLQEYDWPGNVRELENAIERAVILSTKSLIEPEAFQLRKAVPKMPVGKTLKEINKYAILQTMEMTGGNRTRAAEILDVSRRWLQYQLKEWGMVDEH
ncbi:MAG TPA: sigma-54-dependent Fis family transcriptional regulator [Caldithrix abyssi]|uniref:Sigma-54-dependent Fis family transcriptional regulator n=1 Tax=Caldithrix abyssi TaxID=187145 RepID=A0A7V5RPR1_CALAY|nr:sigma-54-dependent Fis family transcriptional regulator [Caldithrix abyssi]